MSGNTQTGSLFNDSNNNNSSESLEEDKSNLTNIQDEEEIESNGENYSEEAEEDQVKNRVLKNALQLMEFQKSAGLSFVSIMEDIFNNLLNKGLIRDPKEIIKLATELFGKTVEIHGASANSANQVFKLAQDAKNNDEVPPKPLSQFPSLPAPEISLGQMMKWTPVELLKHFGSPKTKNELYKKIPQDVISSYFLDQERMKNRKRLTNEEYPCAKEVVDYVNSCIGTN